MVSNAKRGLERTKGYLNAALAGENPTADNSPDLLVTAMGMYDLTPEDLGTTGEVIAALMYQHAIRVAMPALEALRAGDQSENWAAQLRFAMGFNTLTPEDLGTTREVIAALVHQFGIHLATPMLAALRAGDRSVIHSPVQLENVMRDYGLSPDDIGMTADDIVEFLSE